MNLNIHNQYMWLMSNHSWNIIDDRKGQINYVGYRDSNQTTWSDKP